MTAMLSLCALALLSAEVPAQISFLVGEVTVIRAESSYAVRSVNFALNTGDIVTTGAESQCEVQFAHYSIIRLQPHSSIRIDRKEDTKQGVFHRIYTALGSVITKVTKLNKSDAFEMRTDAAQAFIRGTTFTTNVTPDGASSFSVFEGKIAVKSLLEGAKEILLDQNFKTKLTKGEIAPAIEELSKSEIEFFSKQYDDFLKRAKVLDEVREKIEKELREHEQELLEGGKSRLKGCLF